MEQDTEFSHIDSAISSLTPDATSSVSSNENKLPGTIPVPLLADYGHFEKQDEYILVESNDGNTEDGKVNLDDDKPKTSETTDNTFQNDKATAENFEGGDDNLEEGGQVYTENVVEYNH